MVQVLEGERTFLDVNGDPLAGGKVYFYAPGTTNPSNTYLDSAQTVVNTNPIVLDQAGRAVVWGDAQYRQVVYDQFGNLQWDQITGVDLRTGETVLPGGLVVNGGLQVNNANEIGGPSNISGGLVLQAGTGQIIALEVIGGIESPSGTGGLNIYNGLIVNPDAGQIDALLVNGGEQINGPLMIGSSTTPAGPLTVWGDVDVSGTLNITGGININGIIPSDPNGNFLNCWGPAFVDGRMSVLGPMECPSYAGVQITSSIPGDPNGNFMDCDGPAYVNGPIFADAFNLNSDRSLKRDISQLTFDGAEVVRNVPVYRYGIGRSEGAHWGVMAQDLNAATGGSIGADGTVSIGGLITVLWKALQEIDHRLTSLQETVRVHGSHLANFDRRRNKE